MLTYRFYAITHSGERSVGRNIPCKSNRVAMRLAAAFLLGYAAIEVYSGDQMVGSTTSKQASL